MCVVKCIVLLSCFCTALSVLKTNVNSENPIDLRANETRIDRPKNITQSIPNRTETETTTTTATTTTREPKLKTEVSTTPEVTANPSNADKIQETKSTHIAFLEWMGNSYIMSIAIPIVAGIGSAIVLIIIISVCRCTRGRCRRRNRKKFSHDNIHKMNLADRMKLLGETSDEEF